MIVTIVPSKARAVRICDILFYLFIFYLSLCFLLVCQLLLFFLNHCLYFHFFVACMSYMHYLSYLAFSTVYR